MGLHHNKTHHGRITLPPYVLLPLKFHTYEFQTQETRIALSRTRLFCSNNDQLYSPYFSKTSFQQTLLEFKRCGYYNKTKKRKTPLHCYGSTREIRPYLSYWKWRMYVESVVPIDIFRRVRICLNSDVGQWQLMIMRKVRVTWYIQWMPILYPDQKKLK